MSLVCPADTTLHAPLMPLEPCTHKWMHNAPRAHAPGTLLTLHIFDSGDTVVALKTTARPSSMRRLEDDATFMMLDPAAQAAQAGQAIISAVNVVRLDERCTFLEQQLEHQQVQVDQQQVHMEQQHVHMEQQQVQMEQQRVLLKQQQVQVEQQQVQMEQQRVLLKQFKLFAICTTPLVIVALVSSLRR